jgi:hypothetical protein
MSVVSRHRLLWAALLLLVPQLALAQGALQTFGSAFSGQTPMYVGPGQVLPVGGAPSKGAQPANQINPGSLPSGYAVVNPGQGLALYSGYAGACYTQFLQGFDNNGNALTTIGQVAGCPTPTWTINFNGTLFPFPFTQGSVSGPGTTPVTANHVVCWNTSTVLRADCDETVTGAIIGPASFASQSPGLNVKPNTATSTVAYFEGYGTAGSPSAYPLYFTFRDYSVAHSMRFNIQAVNQAGTLIDNAAFINPGLNWWTTGHENTDVDIGGVIDGVGGKVLLAIGAGCRAAFNNSIGGPPCPADLNPSISPGSDGLLDVGGATNRFNNAYFVKAQIKPTTNQNLLIAGPLHLPTGMSFQTYLDNLNPTQFELSASNIQFYVPSGYTRTKIAIDKNLTVQDKLALGDGVSIQSLDDTLGVAKGLEIVGSTIKLTGFVNAASTPTGTPTASLCLDVNGAIIKKTTAGSCI